MPENDIHRITPLLSAAMSVDRYAVRRRLTLLRRRAAEQMNRKNFRQQLAALERRLVESAARRQRRAAERPCVTYDPALPITGRKDDIIAAIAAHAVVIVSGETGSGKTTQLPKYCLAAGRGIDGRIGCTQPRRIAATSVARRIAEEMGETVGRSVGYKIRFQDRTGPDSFIKIVTDGILLAEVQQDPYLSEYDTIIVDEAHERSLNIDFVLGLLKTLLKKRRDLKLIITSATIDTEKFSRAFDDAPVIEVSGRLYPVEVVYFPDDPSFTAAAAEPIDEMTHVETAVAAIRRLKRSWPHGDILVFMPTEQDIRETCEILEADGESGNRVMPLFARLSGDEQARVFARTEGRKIIVATNVAETSLTIPGIRYVVDTGLARVSQYNPRTRTTALPVEPVSRSSADQRRGRCGRVENGVCIRLYSEEDYLSRPLFTPPEILRSNLADVILRMTALRLGDMAVFPFIDRPAAKSIRDGTEVLKELGAVTEDIAGGDAQKAGGGGRGKERPAIRGQARKSGAHPGLVLTRRGALMARLPIDPRLSRMLLEARQQGCLAEVTVIAAALSLQDPRERPADRSAEADRAQAPFVDPDSDFLTLINIWNRYQETWREQKTAGQLKNRMKKFCRTHYLSYRRMREWRDIHAQLDNILSENRFSGEGAAEVDRDGRYAAIHKAVLSGFLSNIAVRRDKNVFQAAKGREVMIFPGSALFNRAGDWIVAAEMIETTRLYARMAATIDRAWLEELGGGLCRSTYLNPRWDARRGEVVASEQVSLFGLVIVTGRTISFGPIDPETAAEVFIRNALMDGDVPRPPAFLQHNRNVIDHIKGMEERIRRRDILVDDEELVRFYKSRLPLVYDLRTLKRLIRNEGGDGFLRMEAGDVMNYPLEKDLLDRYPDRVALGRGRYRCSYRFDPGQPDDGLTVAIPATAAASIPSGHIDRLVPGLLRDKIETLLKSLPKAYRKQLVPIARTAEIVAEEIDAGAEPLISALGKSIYRRFGVDIAATAWSSEGLPEHLKMRIAITGPRGEIIRSGRDAAILRQSVSGDLPAADWEAARSRWEKTRITRWDFGDLAESIDLTLQGGGDWVVFPALAVEETDAGRSINLRLFRNRQAGEASHVKGVAALYRLHFSNELKFLQKTLALSPDRASAARWFGGVRLIEKRLYDTVVSRLFERNIRSSPAFTALAEALAAEIMPCGRDLYDRVLPVIDAYLDARIHIRQLGAANRSTPLLRVLYESLQTGLTRLVPENFIELYDLQRLEQLPRYVRAVGIRAGRAAVNFEKDQVKAAELTPFTAGLDRLLQDLPATVSPEKRKAVEEFFWLIEEYKVSLFAQELRTAVPVSEKRLRDRMREIERLV
ncbi:MAG: ATP-dependent RNA helicase HrpA [Desulfobacterales bacterium]